MTPWIFALVCLLVLAASSAILYAMLQQALRQADALRTKIGALENDLKKSEEKSTENLDRANLDFLRLEKVIAYCKQEVSQLEDELVACEGPDSVRARLNRLFHSLPAPMYAHGDSSTVPDGVTTRP